ncbi:hypothetical protein [Vreelandella glaciei]|uniref:hypothetical protein n=1 Tax=Vreelandella glaciei TaxID=186761 RepID=UPI0030015CD8
MIASLKAKAIGLVVGVLALLSAFLYWQHVTTERDAYQAEAERQRDRAEILQERQQWQRQQIETLSSAMAARDRTLSAIRDDISASTSALEQLGERDAEARDWLDSDRPTGITDWVRELQQTDTDDVRLPDSTPAPNQ